jgi:tRNA modification GTPase
MSAAHDTIAAIATAPGQGAIGILRLSGPIAGEIGRQIAGPLPPPRVAALRRFVDDSGAALDQGLLLWFPAPGSFTGEDQLELQGHGGPRVLELLLARALELGARQARPGEFSERAFLNGKIDLTQAEAIADLIQASTATQVRLANRSLQGLFADQIRALVDRLTRLRALLEASLDFPDEELDGLVISNAELTDVINAVEKLAVRAQRGELIRDGLLIVIAGAPNAGKSSLLNALAGTDAAIVTPIPGTTRDLLRAEIQLDGLLLKLVDTAGLRPSPDPIEQEGIRRARAQIAPADHLLLVIDDSCQPIVGDPLANRETDPASVPLRRADLEQWLSQLGLEPHQSMTLVRNKIDRTGRRPGLTIASSDDSITKDDHPREIHPTEIACSALTGSGLDALRQHLRELAGNQGIDASDWLARRRHLDALRRAHRHLQQAADAWGNDKGDPALAAEPAPELLAEDLRMAQQALGEITGEFSADDLLGRIFSEFCIGK